MFFRCAPLPVVACADFDVYFCAGEFDDMIIAPFFGFDDFQDYYRKCGGKQFLKDVKVPLLVLQVRR